MGWMKIGSIKKGRKNILGFILVLMILMGGSLACSLPSYRAGSSSGPDGIEGSIAQTLTANAPGMSATPEDSTSTPSQGRTNTPAAQETVTPEVSATQTTMPTQTQTPTPDAPSVSVSGDTYCRFGPGDVYEALGILNTDQESELIAKNPSGTFWFIENPDNPGERCWIWGNYATPQGPTEGLPVYTPPPTPTPNAGISASFSYVCAEWYFDFKVKNTGSVAFESYQITLQDKSNGITETTQVNLWPGGCTGGGPDVLHPGDQGRAYAEFLQTSPLGHKMSATLKACQKENLGGTCVTTTFSFTAKR